MALFKSYDAAVSAGYGARSGHHAPPDDPAELEEYAFEAWLEEQRPRLLEEFREETKELREAIAIERAEDRRD
jgi:hypothetical protein